MKQRNERKHQEMIVPAREKHKSFSNFPQEIDADWTLQIVQNSTGRKANVGFALKVCSKSPSDLSREICCALEHCLIFRYEKNYL